MEGDPGQVGTPLGEPVRPDLPPELVLEIAASSAAYDLHDKLHVYRRNGAQEYIVWTMYPRHIEWFRLEEGAYVPVAVANDGVIRSGVFPGLHLHSEALLGEDLPRVLAVLQEGIATAEHATLVDRLTRQGAGDPSRQ